MDFLEQHIKLLLVLWVSFVFLLEHAFPLYKAERLFNLKRIATNLCFGVMVKVAVPLLIIYFIYKLQSFYLWKMPEHLYVYLADILLLDLALYAFHVFAHKNRIVWKFHEIHHLDQKLDATTGLRIHFAEPIIAFVFKVPVLFLMAVPVKIYIIYEFLLSLVGIFHHSNLKVPFLMDKYIGSIITMPSLHCVHHHALPQDTNSNYGFVFTIWDVLFGTMNKVKRQKDWKFGLKYSEDKPLIKMLYYPFTNKYLRNL